MSASGAEGGKVRRIARRTFAALLLLIGGSLVWLGAALVLAGGSPYYVLIGAAVVMTAALCWRGDARAAWVYGAMLAATLAWALWEVGPDGWALVPRLIAPAVLGLWFLTPLGFQAGDASARKWASREVGLMSVLIIGGVLALLVASEPSNEGLAQDARPVEERGADSGDWLHYGNDAAGTRFSPLDQISPANVGRLQVAWTFRTGHDFNNSHATFETTPIKIGDTLYLCSSFNEVIALDADTGKPRWRFDPKASTGPAGMPICRGVSYYRDPAAQAGAPCAERIIAATIDGRLLALDSRRGTPCPGFGRNGQVSLLTGLGPVERGYYLVTSAPQIIRGRIVVGGSVADNMTVGEPSGVIRAYDAVTGRFAWAFDVGRPTEHGEPGPGEHYTRGTPNSWAPISADETLGLVYLPTGNATPDWYGGHRRPFDEQYSSAVVALDAETGAVRWSFQTTHHDLWDYDIGSQPTLYDMPVGGGRRIPALIQPTKRGEIFVLDRRTGKPITPVVERRVPQSDVPGERTSPTQPFSVGMPAFAGRTLSERVMWGVTPIDQAWCRLQFRKARYDGTLTPPRLDRPILVQPGYMGGMDWGGVTIDRARDIMVLNPLQISLKVQLLTRQQADKMGLKPITSKTHGAMGGASAQAGTPYGVDVKPFLSPLMVPCEQPPYGEIAGLNLKTRKLLWRRPLGTAREVGPFGIRSHLPLTMGTPNIGGAITTRSGLTFIGAAQDQFLRAYETSSGRELWKARLPAGGQATPMTYRSPKSGRQFVVIAAGGHAQLGTKLGDHIVAFALPGT